MQVRIKPPMTSIDVDLVGRQPDFTSALRLCQSIGGIDDKVVAGPHSRAIVTNAATWSRITGKAKQHHFPQDKLNDFMDLCGNEAPLFWLALSRGYVLVPMESETQRLLRIEREKNVETEKKLQFAMDLLRGGK
jgi:hypothetical protein